MMSVIWIGMLIASVLASFFTETTAQLSAAILDGAQSAVELALCLSGALCLWSGLAAVMEKAGLMEKLAKLFKPALKRLFPKTACDNLALGYLSSNLTANLLGLGNAATPLGIAAVKRMKHLFSSSTAHNEMCLLIVINTASLQLIPSTVAAVRASLGAVQAFDILPAVWLSSIASVGSGILAAKFFSKWWTT